MKVVIMGLWRALLTVGVLLFVVEQLVATAQPNKNEDLNMVSSSVSEKQIQVPKSMQNAGGSKLTTRTTIITTTTVKPKKSSGALSSKEKKPANNQTAATTSKELKQRITKRNLPEVVSTTKSTPTNQVTITTAAPNKLSAKSSSTDVGKKSPLDLTHAAGHKKKKYVIVKKKKKKPKKKKKIIKVYKKPKKKKYKKVKIHVPKKKKKKKKKVKVIKVHKKKKHHHHHF